LEGNSTHFPRKRNSGFIFQKRVVKPLLPFARAHAPARLLPVKVIRFQKNVPPAQLAAAIKERLSIMLARTDSLAIQIPQ
jgi:hypothetical protein